MKLFQVDLTLEIEAAHDDSADNKLDAFLSSLDLKKNDRIELVELGELVSVDDYEDEEEDEPRTEAEAEANQCARGRRGLQAG